MAVHDIIAAFLSLGVVGVFGISFAEKFVPIVPSYVLLLLLGMTARDPQSLSTMIAATAIGSLSATLGWLAIGRALGERRVERAVARWGKFVFFKLKSYRSLAAAYRRNRFWVTLLGQTVPVARVYLGLPAGVLRLSPVAFVPPAALGILCWNVPFLALGFMLKGSALPPDHVGLWASAILIASEAAIFLGIRAIRRARHRQPVSRAS